MSNFWTTARNKSEKLVKITWISESEIYFRIVLIITRQRKAKLLLLSSIILHNTNMNIIKAYRYERPYTTAAATTLKQLFIHFFQRIGQGQRYIVLTFSWIRTWMFFSTDVLDKSKYSVCAEEKKSTFSRIEPASVPAICRA